jgi:hypothetical protein
MRRPPGWRGIAVWRHSLCESGEAEDRPLPDPAIDRGFVNYARVSIDPLGWGSPPFSAPSGPAGALLQGTSSTLDRTALKRGAASPGALRSSAGLVRSHLMAMAMRGP